MEECHFLKRNCQRSGTQILNTSVLFSLFDNDHPILYQVPSLVQLLLLWELSGALIVPLEQAEVHHVVELDHTPQKWNSVVVQ